MLLCLYRHPDVTPDVARLGLVRDDDVVDVHLACSTSMAAHMKPKRAVEIANALAPPDLLGFLEGGRHSWNALADSLERLGEALQVGLLGPEGEPVVMAKDDVRLVPIVPPAAGWSSTELGMWDTSPVPSPGSNTIVALHTDGQAYLPEYLAVIGSTAESVSVRNALEAVALVGVVRPSRPESACLLHRMPAIIDEELDLDTTIASAVAAASATRTLYPGDVVRCGPPMVVRNLDLRGARAAVDLTDEADILPSR